MRIKLLLITIVISFSQCNSEEKTEKKGNEKSKEEIKEVKVDEKDYLPKVLEGNSFSYPFIVEYNADAVGKIEFDFSNHQKVSATIVYPDNSTEELFFNFNQLIPRISDFSYNNNYHQQLSVYLFEKQMHIANVTAKNLTYKPVSYYLLTNPPRGEYWFLDAIFEENGKSKIVASYRIKLPESIFAKHFEELNNRKFAEFKNFLFNAPEPQKIDYNSIRKMGRFYEGFAASLNHSEPDYKSYLFESIFSLNNSPKKISYFYESDFYFPEMKENGYDTVHFEKHSLKDLFACQTFTYKTTYPLTSVNDSLLELQIDFATKENSPTVRFVMGGIVMSEIPRLKSTDIANGLYLPIGFSKYKNHLITQEAFLLMGNTTGFWLDNSYGRNIDGVTIYFDKNSPYKLHIWLIGGNGTIPVGHYLTSLDQLKKN